MNEDRKDFTQHERGRTFKAALQSIADVEKAKEVISVQSTEIKTPSNPKGSCCPPSRVRRGDFRAADIYLDESLSCHRVCFTTKLNHGTNRHRRTAIVR